MYSETRLAAPFELLVAVIGLFCTFELSVVSSQCGYVHTPSCCRAPITNTTNYSYCYGEENITDITKIHAVFMSHLDIGYSLRQGLNTWSGSAATFGPFRNVCDAYVVNFYNEAIKNAQYFSKNMNFSYKFTHFPWMLYEVLNSTGCPYLVYENSTQWHEYQLNIMNAIENDYIIWNADSENSFWETTTYPYVFNYSLQLSKNLNERFNKNWGKVFKLADVPGIPSTMIPFLNDSGVYAIHMGFGVGGPMLPDLPPSARLNTLWGNNNNPARLFRWKHYPSNKETIVMIEYYYGQWILPHNTTEALAFFYTNENLGPPSINDTLCYLDCLKKSFPKAEIVATSLDEYLENVLLSPQVYNSIPVLNASHSIGDGWVYGIQSDPLKIALSRLTERTIYEKLQTQEVSMDDEELKFYLRKLHKATEHNGGLEGSRCGGSYPVYTSDVALELSQSGNDMIKDANEWIDQRNFAYPPLTTDDIKKLHNTFEISPTWQAIFENLTNITNNILNPKDFNISDSGKNYLSKKNKKMGKNKNNKNKNGKNNKNNKNSKNNNYQNNNTISETCGNWNFEIDLTTGAFIYLENLQTCYNYAENNNQFGNFIYQTFSGATGLPQGAGNRCNPSKFGSCSESFSDTYTLEKYNIYQSNDTCFVEFQFNNNEYNNDNKYKAYEYGAPNKTIILLTMNEYDFEYKFYWFNKPHSCVVQSHYVLFDLPFDHYSVGTSTSRTSNNVKKQDELAVAWIDSLGEKINPANQFNTTVQRFHGIGRGVKIFDGNNNNNFVEFEILDSALVVFGDMNKLVQGASSQASYTPPESYAQLQVILHCNWWGQAFPQWYDLNGMSRINVKFNPHLTSIC